MTVIDRLQRRLVIREDWAAWRKLHTLHGAIKCARNDDVRGAIVVLAYNLVLLAERTGVISSVKDLNDSDFVFLTQVFPDLIGLGNREIVLRLSMKLDEELGRWK